MDLEFFSLCYFPKYFDRRFGEFHKELFEKLKYMLDNKGLTRSGWALYRNRLWHIEYEK